MCFFRRFREQVLGELRHQHDDIIELTRLVRLDLGVDMATNDDLAKVDADLTEGLSELSGLPQEIADLVAAAGDQADPALVASVLAKAEAIKNIVPDAPAPEPTPEPTPEPEPAPVDETPAEPAPDA